MVTTKMVNVFMILLEERVATSADRRRLVIVLNAANVTHQAKVNSVEIACTSDMENMFLKLWKIQTGFVLAVVGFATAAYVVNVKGGLPTGAAYKKIRKLGFKYVAHYLIKTNNESKTSEDDETDAAEDSQDSAKRLRSFKEAKESSEEDHLVLMITDWRQDDNHNDDDDGINKHPDSARKLYGDNQTSVIDVRELSDHKALAVNKMNIKTPVIIDAEAQGNETEKND